MKITEFKGYPGRWGREVQPLGAERGRTSAMGWYPKVEGHDELALHVEQKDGKHDAPWCLAAHPVPGLKTQYLPWEFDSLEAAALYAHFLEESGPLAVEHVPWLKEK